MFKPIKHVHWVGLPPIEEDEIRAAKRKMMKDAPKGVEENHKDEEENQENDEI